MNTREIFRKDALKEVKELLSGNSNVYLNFLKESLAEQKDGEIRNSLPHLIEYGLNRVKDEEDFPLSDYFFVLSELSGISEKTRSFLMDTMVYCEDKHIEFKNPSEIKAFYEKEILPLL